MRFDRTAVVRIRVPDAVLDAAIGDLGRIAFDWGWGESDTPTMTAADLRSGQYWLFKVLTNDNWQPINWHTLLFGLSLLAEEYPEHFSEILLGTASSRTKDLLVQLALFGKVQYD